MYFLNIIRFYKFSHFSHYLSSCFFSIFVADNCVEIKNIPLKQKNVFTMWV